MSGIILFIMALAAFIVCNSPWANFYDAIWNVHLSFHLGGISISEPLLFWINDGLMTLFFLLVGLELKREFIEGELNSLSRIALPGIAALGGMLVPAVIYCLINAQDPQRLQGWAVPVATDIAFALGVLSLFGKKVPIGLRLFLLALAIFDDVGAIIIIAIFHTTALHMLALVSACILILLLFILNLRRVNSMPLYLGIGLALWICVLQSGVHATVSGVLLSLMIPLKAGKTLNASPLHRLEKTLHPWVIFFVMPLFAFANAGVSLVGLKMHVLTDTLLVGIVAGLFFGKQLGVFGFSWLLIQMGWAKLPEKTSWGALYGVALLCGIGFTMSLFLGTLAFQGSSPVYLIEVRLGVLAGSMLSGIVGAVILRCAFHQSKSLSRL